MVNEATDARAGDNPFEELDPRLTIFALANGMDLVKEPDSRRLEWFSEGLERAIRIQVEDADSFSLTVLSWKSRKMETLVEAPLTSGASTADVGNALNDAIESANGLTLD